MNVCIFTGSPNLISPCDLNSLQRLNSKITIPMSPYAIYFCSLYLSVIVFWNKSVFLLCEIFNQNLRKVVKFYFLMRKYTQLTRYRIMFVLRIMQYRTIEIILSKLNIQNYSNHNLWNFIGFCACAIPIVLK